ncbi:helix-hairpin-helix domain-containing protein [Tautonia plasticadhaerens]|uniref:Photosystem II complex extrinsic protein U n=1 Tax=Tautonia plasticadhaerens TaxID=2527974 RepID=A0A518HFB9_9BACT|nr:helix-hairpin-helix domain-containing protein [Tautonia plasticadhaerens]QDV39476.1 photosystem II complex extrinsic protein precursor U [Tautonia plasticadhaerens]
MPPLRLVVDRFEGRSKHLAVLVAEDGHTAVLPRDLLPEGTRGGEVLVVSLAPADDAKPPGPSGSAVDVNTAPVGDLKKLPGVGPVLADRIVDARPYGSVDDLSRVVGLDAASLERLRPLASAGSATRGPQSPSAPIRLRVERPAEGPGGDVRLATEDGREVVLPGDLLPGPAGAGG